MSKLPQLDFTLQFFFQLINERSAAMYTGIPVAIHTVQSLELIFELCSDFCDAVCLHLCVKTEKGKSIE